MTKKDDSKRPYAPVDVMKQVKASHYSDWASWMQTEAKVGAWSYSIATQDVWWSPEVFRIYDLPVAKEIPSPFKFYSEADGKRLVKAMNDAIADGTPWDLILRIITAKQARKWMRSTGTVSFEGGEMIIHGTAQDITSWYSELRSMQEFAESSPDFIMRLNIDGTILDVNRTLAYLNKSDVIGKDIFYFTPLENIPAARKALEECLAQKRIVTYESSGPGEDKNQTYWYMNRMIPVVINEYVDSIILVTMDVTKDVELQQKIRHQKYVLEQQSRLVQLGEITAGVGHEINNPLTILLGTVSKLERMISLGDVSAKEVKAIVEDQKESCLRIKDVVWGMREISRQSPETEITNVNEAIRMTIKMVTQIYKARGIKISYHSRLLDSQMAKINKGTLQLGLMNLFSNANDAMSECKEKIIAVSAEDLGSDVLIAVDDSGAGIPTEISDRIFQPFFTTKEIGKGTGLGLSITAANLQRGGGSFRFEKSPLGGARFLFQIPKADKSEEKGSHQLANEAVKSDPLQILLVDDELTLLYYMRQDIEEMGAKVETASSADDALKKLKTMHFDALFTDNIMPRKSGMDLIKEVKNQKLMPEGYVVLFTGGLSGDFDQLRENGDIRNINAILRKPLDYVELATALMEIRENRNRGTKTSKE